MAAALGPRPAGPGPVEALVILGVLVLWEVAAAEVLPRGIASVGALRVVETAVCLGYWKTRGRTLGDLGLTGPRARRGWVTGAIVTAGFGVVVGLTELAGRLLWGESPLRGLAGSPSRGRELVGLLVVGGLVAPLFEELVFRGFLYGGLRRRSGPLVATAAVTVLFAAAHAVSAPVPWIQAVGGLVFCAAYEISGSLWAPIAVHASGNIALFLLPTFFR